MLQMACPMLLAASAVPVGQQLFTHSGDVSFVVPAGVTLISAVAIGRGGASVNDDSFGGDTSGGGGGLSYSNDISVTPGETLTVSISQTGTTVAGGSRLLRGTTTLLQAAQAVYDSPGSAAAGVGQVRYSGGYGVITFGTLNPCQGAGAAGYTGDGQDGAAGPAGGGGGTSANGGGAGASAGVSGTQAGVNYGGGAGQNGVSQADNGGLGCVRIIWGPGRAFPNTNTGDV